MNSFFEQVFNEANHKLTTTEFIAKAKNVHPEYDYSKVNYTGALDKVEVICPKHGSFFIKPSNLLTGSGCRKCAIDGRANNRNEKARERFISLAKELHPEYDYTNTNYVNALNKVEVICPKHGSFFILPQNFLKGQGCPKCSSERVAKKQTSTTDEFVNKAKILHPELDFSEVNYVNAHTKVKVICPKHGVFYKEPGDLLKKGGHGCPKCGHERCGKHVNTNEFIEKVKKIHPEYDYSKVNYTGAFDKVEITCPKHGSFFIMPSNLLRGSGCLQCANEKRSNNNDELIEKAKMFHPEYDYSKTNYVNARTKVIVTCPKHGDFSANPAWLIKGVGCPVCSESKGESFIRSWLLNHKISFIGQHRFNDLRRYPYDFYLPNFNLLIEYNGEQHYKEVSVFHRKSGDFEGQLVRDHLKKSYAERNGYNLLVIPYWEFKNIDKILSEKLLST